MVIVECSDGDVVVVDRDIASRWSAAIRTKLGTINLLLFASCRVSLCVGRWLACKAHSNISILFLKHPTAFSYHHEQRDSLTVLPSFLII